MNFHIDIQAWIFVFLIVCASDITWTYCIRYVQNLEALRAGVWGGAFYLTQGLATQDFTSHKDLLIPATVGSVIGTALTVWWQKRQQQKKKPETLKDLVVRFDPAKHNTGSAWPDEPNSSNR